MLHLRLAEDRDVVAGGRCRRVPSGSRNCARVAPGSRVLCARRGARPRSRAGPRRAARCGASLTTVEVRGMVTVRCRLPRMHPARNLRPQANGRRPSRRVSTRHAGVFFCPLAGKNFVENKGLVRVFSRVRAPLRASCPSLSLSGALRTASDARTVAIPKRVTECCIRRATAREAT